MAEPIRIALCGLGPIGALIARIAAERPSLRIVGAIDTDPAKAGQSLADVAALDSECGVVISDDASAVLAAEKPQVVLHSTGSRLTEVAPQLQQLLQAGSHVVSTCEELSYPWRTEPELARRLDEQARETGLVLLGTGINPGFIMDVVLLTLSGLCRSVTRVQALRTVDASERRMPLQMKIGAGLLPDEFQRRVDAGLVRHVGLRESVYLLADALGWPLDDVTEDTSGVPAAKPVVTPYLRVEPGQMAGVLQVATGWQDGQEKVRLELRMYVGAEDPGDRLTLEGDPNLSVDIRGVHGDTSTAAIVVNAVPQAIRGAAGLVTLADLPTAHWVR